MIARRETAGASMAVFNVELLASAPAPLSDGVTKDLHTMFNGAYRNYTLGWAVELCVGHPHEPDRRLRDRCAGRGGAEAPGDSAAWVEDHVIGPHRRHVSVTDRGTGLTSGAEEATRKEVRGDFA
jgi:hypothetical protein